MSVTSPLGGERRGEARVSVRLHPSGEFRARIVSRGFSSHAEGEALVRCSKLQVTAKRSQLPAVGFGGLPRWTAFGASARRKVRDSVAVLDSKPRQLQLFLTGTLPSVDVKAFEAISKYSAWVVQNVTQWIRDIDPHAQYVWVWEFQKRGALHWHCAVVLSSSGAKRTCKRGFRQKWISLLLSLQNICSVPLFIGASGVDHGSNTRVVRARAETVRKSLSRYLAKYLCKGTTVQGPDVLFPPSRWWSSDRKTCRDVAAGIKTLVSPCLGWRAALELRDSLFGKISAVVEKVVHYANPVDSRLDGLVGFFDSGCLSSARSLLLKWLQGGRGRPTVDALSWVREDSPSRAFLTIFGEGTKTLGAW